MSLVIEAPETLPAEVQPYHDDAPALVSPPTGRPTQHESSPSRWQALIHRFSKRHTRHPVVLRPSESAIDFFAREQPFFYIKVLSG